MAMTKMMTAIAKSIFVAQSTSVRLVRVQSVNRHRRHMFTLSTFLNRYEVNRKRCLANSQIISQSGQGNVIKIPSFFSVTDQAPLKQSKRLLSSNVREAPSFIPSDIASEYPVWHKQSIEWGDMDAFQHVNNVVYFRYFENARIAYLFELKRIAKKDFLTNHAIGPIMADARARFRLPLTFPDTIYVGIRAELVERNQMQLAFKLFSEQHQDRIVAEGNGRMVSVNYPTGKKADFPPSMVEAMVHLQPNDESLQALIHNDLD
eukprot:gene1796-7975_t